MILPGLPGGDPLPRRSLLDAVGFWLPTDDPDPFPEVTLPSSIESPRDPYWLDFDRPRYSAMMSIGMTQPNAHALVPNYIDPGTLEEIMDDLFMADPDGYRLLSEYIVLPDGRHDAVMSEWRSS